MIMAQTAEKISIGVLLIKDTVAFWRLIAFSGSTLRTLNPCFRPRITHTIEKTAAVVAGAVCQLYSVLAVISGEKITNLVPIKCRNLSMKKRATSPC